ncbi:ribbon-helix-helix protein, CopG family [Candidatus Acetothermia bacterium]|nr:ribbon-helix-helix protein, CopG family [Candidatus Acetothermia bacterium]
MSSRIINMTVPEELLQAADELAESEGRTRSELIREAVRRYVEEQRSQKKNSRQLLSRLAAHAVKGPNLTSSDLDKLLYDGKRPR